MGTNSTRRRAGGKAVRKPKKPRKDFPLYAHAVGRWAKKVCGKTVYFTLWREDPKGVAALEEWLDQKDDLQAGRKPRAKSDGLVVGDLCNLYLADKEQARDIGELSPRTFQTCYGTCDIVCKHLGRDRAVADLVPDDFRKLRAKLAKTRGAVALGNEVMRVRGIFKFAFDEGLILAPVKYGQSFGKPKPEVAARARENHRLEHGDRMFEAAEIRQMLITAKQPLKAMVLLAANCAFGNTDLSSLPLKALDLDAGWVDFARVKTAVRRKCWLWPETVAAICEWLSMRPKPKDLADAKLLFLTCRGQRWVKISQSGAPCDALGQEFAKVLHKLGLKRPKVGFYALRHGFETIAGETTDQVAVDAVMGHKPKGMAAHYRERIGDDRLRRVAEHVRQWLFDSGDAPQKKNREICDPNDPCDPNDAAPVCDPIDPGSHGTQGSQNTQNFLEERPRLRIVG